jgi:hypothetical protein
MVSRGIPKTGQTLNRTRVVRKSIDTKSVIKDFRGVVIWELKLAIDRLSIISDKEVYLLTDINICFPHISNVSQQVLPSELF